MSKITFNSIEKKAFCVFVFLLLCGFSFANWGERFVIKKKETPKQIQIQPIKKKKIIRKSNKSIISINQANLKSLIQIKGIGKVTAQRILNYRKKKGLFKHLKELLEIKGIGSKKLQKILPQVSL